MGLTKEYFRAPLFMEKRDPEDSRTKVSALEADATLGVLGNFFTGKSGQIGGALYTVNTKHEIFERYTECYEQIREACHRKGRILSDNPRSRNCLLYNILTRIRLRRSTNLPERIQELRKELARADDDLDREDIQAELDIACDHLHPDEVMVWMDFCSWHSDHLKWENMICVVQFMENQELETLYVDVPCCDPDTAAHNHYYFFQAYDVLLGHSGIFFINGAPRWKKIYRVSDNGTPFMNRYSCLTESFMQEKYNISIVVLPLCQYHAWSLCDSHGGVVKAKMKRAEI